MSDPMKELDSALGVLSDVEIIKEEPWNYEHKPAFKMPAQELVNTGQASPVVDVTEDMDNDYEYQRQNFYNLVERGNDAITGILELSENRSIQGHMRILPATLSNKLRRLQKNLETYKKKMKRLKEVPDNLKMLQTLICRKHSRTSENTQR